MKFQLQRSFFLIFLVFTLTGCPGSVSGNKGNPLSEDRKTDEKEESWHMLDEAVRQQHTPAEEEAFRQAAYEGNLEAVRMFLKMEMKPDAMDQDGHTALMFAAFNGHSEIVISLLDAGAEIDKRDFMDRTALLYGATGPFPETVKILLERGADPNTVDSNEHFSPLMHASAEGNLEVVKVLLAYGADCSLVDVDGDDAETFAAQAGHMQVVEFLKEAKQ